MLKKFVKVVFLSLLAVAGCRSEKQPALKMEKSGVLLDVRTPEEFHSGALQGAVNLPHLRIAEKINSVAPDKNTPLYIYCRSGRRVKIAMETLTQLGYTKLFDLGGLEDARAKLELDVVKND
jgi:phage shock protein E